MTAFDTNLVLLAWLKTSTALQALVGTNIFGGVLPEGFSSEDGSKALCIRRRGGKRHGEIPVLHGPSFAVEAYAPEEPIAAQIYATASEFMHGATNIDLGAAGVIILAQEEVEAQDVVDPMTHFPMTVGYFRILTRPAGS